MLKKMGPFYHPKLKDDYISLKQSPFVHLAVIKF